MSYPIMIIDDIRLTLEHIHHHLEIAGFQEIELYENPKDALLRMRQGIRPSLIITDFQMPDMNGMELLQTVERLYGKIPGIITTSDPSTATACSSKDYPVLKKGVPHFISELLSYIGNIRENLSFPSGKLFNNNGAVRLHIYNLASMPVYGDSITGPIL